MIRVPPAHFVSAEHLLAGRFARDERSVRTGEFAAFAAPDGEPPLGIRLAATGGAFDGLHGFCGALRANSALLDAYNGLKTGFDGLPVKDWRLAKAMFVAAVLDGVRRGEISAAG